MAFKIKRNTQVKPTLEPQDILSRIPYGLQVRYSGAIYKVTGYIASGDKLILCDPKQKGCELIVEMDCIKPLLRKMDNMSLEERLNYKNKLEDVADNKVGVWEITEYLNSKMLDYKNLIDDGLAEERQP